MLEAGDGDRHLAASRASGEALPGTAARARRSGSPKPASTRIFVIGTLTDTVAAIAECRTRRLRVERFAGSEPQIIRV